MKKILFILLVFSTSISFAQSTFVIKGKIMDAVTHDPIPFASVSLKNSTFGKNTDFEGNFSLVVAKITADSLLVSCMGYTTKSFYISRDSTIQTLNIQLKPSEILLHEVKVYASGETPAYKIIRKAVAANTAQPCTPPRPQCERSMGLAPPVHLGSHWHRPEGPNRCTDSGLPQHR